MIAFAKEFLRRREERPIRLNEPATTIVVTGARRESIDAVFGPDRRLVRMIVHTRSRSPCFRFQL